MLSTWIEAPARGRLSGPVRAGMWSSVVIGTHPIADRQEVWLEVSADDTFLGRLPAFWVENKGANSFWHVPVPPQAVGVRLRYRAGVRNAAGEVDLSPDQEVVVRPNLPPGPATAGGLSSGPAALTGNRRMTIRVDEMGSTYDLYFPTVGLHADVRPAQGDLPESRCHFRAIIGGLAIGHRLDWFCERRAWEADQNYRSGTNILDTALRWRCGPVRAGVTDFAVLGPTLPRSAGDALSQGQYIKRFRLINDGPEDLKGTFGVFVHTEVNGGLGEPGLSWHDADCALRAINRGHPHTNRKLARDATLEFAIALDARGEVYCEAAGPNEALLLRPLELPAGRIVIVDLIVSGAFTGWRGDTGTFDHWLRPALTWFRSVDLDQVEQEAVRGWQRFLEPVPTIQFPRPAYNATLRRSTLAMALHADAEHGSVAGGFDRGLRAYAWPRDAVQVGGTFERLGHPDVARAAFLWLDKARTKHPAHPYWFQKYSIDGSPEWESPALDQSALIPWGLERHYRRTGDLALLEALWPMVQQAAEVCMGRSSHPGLSFLEDLSLVTSFGIWDRRYGAFLYSNAAAVAGLRAAAAIAEQLDRATSAAAWTRRADRIWEVGILGQGKPGASCAGLVDPDTGRFLEARRISLLPEMWTTDPALLVERSASIDVSLLGPALPFGLVPADDPHVQVTAEAILKHNQSQGDSNGLECWSPDPALVGPQNRQTDPLRHDAASLATLWMARYLIQLGRETGEGRAWTRALALLDHLVNRLCDLGLSVRQGRSRTEEPCARSATIPGVWALHASLAETLLDWAGLDWDTPRKRLMLDPALPPTWPSIGLTQALPWGSLSYRLERPSGGVSYRLSLETDLREPIQARVSVTCPGLDALGHWEAADGAPAPAFDRARRRLSWEFALPAGPASQHWSWR